MTKKCTKCGIEKYISEYNKRKLSKDGYNFWCKSCQSVESKEYRNTKEVKERKSSFVWKQNRHQVDKERNIRNPKIGLLAHARKRAKEKNIEFNITQNDVNIPKFCPVLGIPIFIGDGKFHDGSPTIDRVDPTKGYIKGNVMVISWRANSLKKDCTVAEIDKVIDYMEKYL